MATEAARLRAQDPPKKKQNVLTRTGLLTLSLSGFAQLPPEERATNRSYGLLEG